MNFSNRIDKSFSVEVESVANALIKISCSDDAEGSEVRDESDSEVDSISANNCEGCVEEVGSEKYDEN